MKEKNNALSDGSNLLKSLTRHSIFREKEYLYIEINLYPNMDDENILNSVQTMLKMMVIQMKQLSNQEL